MIKQLPQSNDKVKMIMKYIKKCISFLGLSSDYDKKLTVKILVPGVESGWNNNGSFKYKNRVGENVS